MPTSNWENISYSVDLIRRLDPSSVLDVGCGFGQWGFLCREYLDVWGGSPRPEDWRVVIDGIEVFSVYITHIQESIYHHIYIGDARDVLPEVKSYDLVILGDVLEHLTKKDAENLLEIALQHANKGVLIHVPLGPHWPQGPHHGNIHETHRSVWSIGDLRRYGAGTRVFRDFEGRPFAVALIRKTGTPWPTKLGLWWLRWRSARKYDLRGFLSRLIGKH